MPELPPPPPSVVPAHLISLEADLWLSRGNRRAAEWLSHRAEALREGQP
jgi:hypothetical protein